MSRRVVTLMGAVCVSYLASTLVWSPVAPASAGATRSSFESVPPPPPIDPGESPIEPAEAPPYEPRQTRVPPPVAARVVARPDAAVAVAGLPVSVRVVDSDATVELAIESLPAADVARLGGEVFAFGVTPVSPVSDLRLELTVDYSSFRFALGADWAQRLQFVKWDCEVGAAKLETPGCGNPQSQPEVSNDLEAGVLTATVDIGFESTVGSAESRPTVLAGNGSVLGLASSAGSFAATTLSTAGAWQAGGNDGSFSYDSPISVPPAFSGLGPSVSLSYDSGAVDGVTSAVNSQASEVGLGWNLSAGQGFIERRYLPCTDPRIGGGTPDTCWFAQNATISLNGRASELVPVNGTTGSPSTFTLWRLKDDPDWLVERFNSPQGDWWTSEKWKVTTPEGMVYWFGQDDAGQGSRLVRPLRGINSASDPCWARANKLCTDMPYRWMLDRVVDPSGNFMIYKYLKEQNKARVLGDGFNPVQYDMAGLLTDIFYGRSPNANPAIGYRGRVVFSYVRRCGQALSTSVDAHCPAVTNANGTSYPDTPTDLYCPPPSATCHKEPSFFQIRRLSMVTTYTSANGVTWSPAGQWRTYGAFPDPLDGGNEKLWLSHLLRVSPDSPVAPPVHAAGLSHGTIFGGTRLPNRKDGNPNAGVPYMHQFRLSTIFDDLGKQTTVSYTSPDCGPNYDWSTNTTNCFPMYASFPGGGSGWGIYRRWVVDKIVERDLVAGPRPNVPSGTGVAPDVTTDYAYGGAAWRHDGTDWWVDTPGVDDVSWGQWRGYRTVTTTVGTSATKTVNKQVFYQGMHGDKAAIGTKNVTMTRGFPVTGEGYVGTINDDDWLAGSVFESYQMEGASVSDFITATRNYSRWTALSNDATTTRVGLPVVQSRKWAMTLEHSAVRDGGPGVQAYQYTRTDTVVDSYGRVGRVHSSGFTDVAGDETCQKTIYINGSTTPTTSTPGWMHLVAQSVTWAGQGTLPNQTNYAPGAGVCTGQPTGETKYFYNNNPHTVSPNVASNAANQTLSASLKPIATATLTRTKNWDGVTDLLDRWTVNRLTFDAAGRTTETFDARGTRTALFGFDTTYGYPNQATHPAGLGTTSTVLRPNDGHPASTTDQNGNTTNYCYDTLSRLTKAFQPPLAGGATPGCASAAEPSVRYAYNLGSFTVVNGVRVAKTPAIVLTSVLQSSNPVVRVESAAYVDGHGRTRETQAWSPTGGQMVVTATLSDDRGNAITSIEPFSIADTPGNHVSPVSNGVDGFATYPNLPNLQLHSNVSTIDTAGRTTAQTRKHGNTALVTTSTEYHGSTTVTKPQLGSWSATTVDALGRTIRAESYNGAVAPVAPGLAAAGAVTTVQFGIDQTPNAVNGHDTSGWIVTTTTDDAGNETHQLRNMSGHTMSTSDPNAGTSGFEVDANGNVTATTDPKGTRINTTYDQLNRPIRRWAGYAGSFDAAAATDRLASWTYDTAPGGLGMPATETSWQSGVAFATTITGYSGRYQAMGTAVRIPGSFGVDLLAGDWKFATSYNEAGQPVTVTKPLAPVDPATPNAPPSATDVTTTHYNGLGQADTLWEGIAPTNDNRYVLATAFDAVGRVTGRTLSRSTDAAVPALQREYAYDTPTGALAAFRAGWKVGAAPVTWFQHDSYARDPIGRVTRVDDLGIEADGTPSNVRECFVYDQWNHLVRAHTATLNAACVANVNAATVATGTLDAYDTVWTFDDINRITSTTSQFPAGAATAYNYGVPGHPHAVSTLTGGDNASYSYDANGAMTNRDGDTLTYDAQQRLIDYGASESYTYTTTNQRLIRTAGGTRTLYLPGLDVTVEGVTRTINAFVVIGATQVATKTVVTGGITTYSWLCGNMQNTNVCQAEAYVEPTAPATPERRRYTPYGEPRNDVEFASTDRGFLNQPEDANGLVYLNNRYHDPSLGSFISVDPLVATTGQPYLYANGNPSTLSDPSGLCAGAGYVAGKCVTDEDTRDGAGGGLGARGVSERARWRSEHRMSLDKWWGNPGDRLGQHRQGWSDSYFSSGRSTFTARVGLSLASQKILDERASGQVGNGPRTDNDGYYVAELAGYDANVVAADGSVDDSKWYVRGGVAISTTFVKTLGTALVPLTMLEGVADPQEPEVSTTVTGYFLVTSYTDDGTARRTELLALQMEVTTTQASQRAAQQLGTRPSWNPLLPAIGLVFSGNANNACAKPCKQDVA